MTKRTPARHVGPETRRGEERGQVLRFLITNEDTLQHTLTHPGSTAVLHGDLPASHQAYRSLHLLHCSPNKTQPLHAGFIAQDKQRRATTSTGPYAPTTAPSRATRPQHVCEPLLLMRTSLHYLSPSLPGATPVIRSCS
jgi:hypothetical protein